jgi:hypothetical protein
MALIQVRGEREGDPGGGEVQCSQESSQKPPNEEKDTDQDPRRTVAAWGRRTKAGADGQISGRPERRWLGTRSWEKGRRREEARKAPGHGDQSDMTDIGPARKEMARNQDLGEREAEEEARKAPGHGDQSDMTYIGPARKEMARNQVPREVLGTLYYMRPPACRSAAEARFQFCSHRVT